MVERVRPLGLEIFDLGCVRSVHGDRHSSECCERNGAGGGVESILMTVLVPMGSHVLHHCRDDLHRSSSADAFAGHRFSWPDVW